MHFEKICLAYRNVGLQMLEKLLMHRICGLLIWTWLSFRNSKLPLILPVKIGECCHFWPFQNNDSASSKGTFSYYSFFLTLELSPFKNHTLGSIKVSIMSLHRKLSQKCDNFKSSQIFDSRITFLGSFLVSVTWEYLSALSLKVF